MTGARAPSQRGRQVQVSFDNSYARLPARFYHRQPATPVPDPGLIAVNAPLARALGIDPDWLASDAGIAVLAGNAVPAGADPLAQAYAGHQFGGWNPQLGDGRALLLGEVIDTGGTRRDIQLKGSGPTPFSRMGDGRAWIGPVLREYIVSEAMHALGVPTTRALAAVTTGAPVLREEGHLPGAVLTRVAASHIRVGTFQFFDARGDEEAVRLLAEHVISRHHPQAADALGLLEAVIAAQADLVARWMGLGFIHGVMNTDNTSVAGETIDYGPCAFMDVYAADRVFSAIDHYGRYAYNQQPRIAVWNLAQFATCLLPLIDDDADRAVDRATVAVHRFPDHYAQAWRRVFGAKLGLRGPLSETDATLAEDLLQAMEAGGADFTLTFAGLADGTARDAFADPAPYDAWAPAWHDRLAARGGPDTDAMARANPRIIPRTHLIEAAIAAAVAGDLAPFHRLTAALDTPFAAGAAAALRATPTPEQAVHRTFCGT